MITAAAPSWAAEEAATRAAAGQLPAWLVMPGWGDGGSGMEVVACDPEQQVGGSSVADLQAAWTAAREAWGEPTAGIPVGIGALSYDLGRQFENWGADSRPPSGWPDLDVRFYGALWVRHSGTGRTEFWGRDAAALERLRQRLAEPQAAGSFTLGPLQAVEPAERHREGVRRILAYLRAGDAYQVNLARRLRARVIRHSGAPGLALFARLQRHSPAPHGIWLGNEDHALVGNSPERFLARDPEGSVATWPIKGTRPRGTSLETDGALRAALLADPKDRAEHVMIVDLERNDLGRVCALGSVQVQACARLLSLPTVHHLESVITGHLRPEVGLADLLRATFPGGSITGAPKIRAMEIIAELEAARRGPYTGATGWFGAAGDLDLAVAIRTALWRDDEITVWVGGGIVIDSDPAEELAETEAKAAAFARVCGGTEG